MNRRNLFKWLILSSFIASNLLGAHAFSQESKESKVRLSGSTGSIKIVGLRAVERNGLLTVQVSFENDSSRTTPINYRFKWLDNDKMKVTDDETWKPLNLFGGQTVDLMGVAPTPQATDFIIELNGSN